MINIRDVVRLSHSWEDEQEQDELHKLLVPVLVNALDYDIQEAANHALTALQSGVTIAFFSFYMNNSVDSK